MPGVLIHSLAALISMLIVHLRHFKLEYSLAIFLGNFTPDVIKFGLSAIKQGTLYIFKVKHDNFYWSLANITSHPANWFALGFFIIGLTVLLYHFHYIKKKTMKEYDELYIFFLVGILTHLILDVLIIEKGPWI